MKFFCSLCDIEILQYIAKGHYTQKYSGNYKVFFCLMICPKWHYRQMGNCFKFCYIFELHKTKVVSHFELIFLRVISSSINLVFLKSKACYWYRIVSNRKKARQGSWPSFSFTCYKSNVKCACLYFLSKIHLSRSWIVCSKKYYLIFLWKWKNKTAID